MSEEYRYRQERREAEKKNQKQQKGRNKSKKGSILKKVILLVFLLGILAVGIVSVSFASMMREAPQLDSSKLVVPLSTKFYDKNGNFLYEYGKEKRTKVTYSQLPKRLEEAFISIEDSRFYQHHGVDIKGTSRAIIENLTGRFGSQGGSTITQQVIKNSFLTPEKTIKRKVQEWSLAYQLEKKYSKHQILMMYLNRIYLGNGSYGIATAAKSYYGIDSNHLNQLTLSEIAMLAGLPQSPSHYDPSEPENQKAATNRRNLVLSAMYDQGYISKKEMTDAQAVPVSKGLIPKSKNQGMKYEAFLDAAVKEVEGKLKNIDITSDGLSIYTTIDPKAQDYADKILNTNSVIPYPNAQFQGAFVFLDTKTGEVRAIGSGRNDHKATFRGNNFAIDIKRQPGSSFKPILDYGPAIENFKWSTAHQINDQKTTYVSGESISNWDNKYHGMISIRKALQYSYNIPALLTLREVGMDKAKDFAEDLGILFNNDTVYESYSIGSNTVNPLEMAGAYSAFGNKGVYNQPHFVQKVVYPNGKEVNFKPKPKQVMHDYTAYLITDMLRTVVKSGTGTTANIQGIDVAGKTGTTNFALKTRTKYKYPKEATNDSWMAGYTPQYTMAVWTGYVKNGSANYMLGDTTKISQLIFKNMMQTFGTDKSAFLMPSDVYRMNNELYIKGGNPKDIPTVPKKAKKEESSNGAVKHKPSKKAGQGPKVKRPKPNPKHDPKPNPKHGSKPKHGPGEGKHP